MKKYELTSEAVTLFGKKLFRIRAIIDFGDVKAGDLGGCIEKEDNLSHEGNAWIYGNARVYDNAWVSGNARVCGDASVYGNARVYGKAEVCNNSDYITIGPIGSRNDTVTFMRSRDNKIIVKCGCFTGDIDTFIAKVRATHGDNEHGKAYLLAAEMAKVRIKLEEAA